MLEQVKAIDAPLQFETYYSLSCHNCPDVVQALNLMSALNPHITHTAIDGGLFQDEVKDREVMGVPTVFVNGERFGQGRMELAEIVAKVDTGAAAREAARDSAKEAFDVLVVGGGPAGAAAAIYAAPQGHPHRDCCRAPGRPGAGHRGHRELHLGQQDRRPRAGRGHGGPHP